MLARAVPFVLLLIGKGGKGGAHGTLRKKMERERERSERERGLRGRDRRELLARADGPWYRKGYK